MVMSTIGLHAPARTPYYKMLFVIPTVYNTDLGIAEAY